MYGLKIKYGPLDDFRGQCKKPVLQNIYRASRQKNLRDHGKAFCKLSFVKVKFSIQENQLSHIMLQGIYQNFS